MTPALDAYKSATAPFLALTRQIGDAGPSKMNAARFETAGLAARAASFRLWQVADQELDRLLRMRIKARRQARLWALSFSALTLIISSGLAYLVMHSITAPLGKLARSLGPGATLLAESTKRIAEVSQQESPNPAESAIICEELTAQTEDMRSAVGELLSLVNGGEIPGHSAGGSAADWQASNDLRSAA